MDAFLTVLFVSLISWADPLVNAFCTTSGQVIIPKQDDSKVIHVISAEMWICPEGDNSTMQCAINNINNYDYPFGCREDALWIPRVFSILRFWCQNKKSCKFDPLMILSQHLSNTSSLLSKNNYVFKMESEMVDTTALLCPYPNSSMRRESCFMPTSTELEWGEARSVCRRHGGDLAHFFYGDIQVPVISNSNKNVSMWFKKFSLKKEQRSPWHFNKDRQNFSCIVFDIQQQNDYVAATCGSPTDSRVGEETRKIGLCVLPPLLPEEYTCTGKCFTEYHHNFCWDDSKVDTKVFKVCPVGFEGTSSWICGADGQWLTPRPDLSNCTHMAVVQSSGLGSTIRNTLPQLTRPHKINERHSRGEIKATQLPNIDLLPAIKLDDKMGRRCAAVCVSGYVNFCWEETEAGTNSLQSCPLHFQGTASWICGSDGQWSSPTPDLRNCTDKVMDDYIIKTRERMRKGEDPITSIKSLTHAVDKQDLVAGSIMQVEQAVRLAISKQRERLTLNSDPTLRDANSRNFTSYVVDLVDVLLANDKAFWGLRPEVRRDAIDRVQKNIDDTLHLLTRNLVDKKFRKVADNLIVQVENRVKEDYVDKTYTFLGRDRDQLILPSGFPRAVGDNNIMHLSFAVFPSIHNILYGDKLAHWEEMLRNGTTRETLKQVVVSNVFGATLGEPDEPVRFVNGKVEMLLSNILNLTHYDVDRASARCVYWDVSTQYWSSNGCQVLPNNDSSIIRCQCNHLTNFAVLMDINGIFQNKKVLALEYITIAGESISIVCLTLVIIIFLWVRKLRNEFRIKIHRNLCINMLIAEIIMLAGLDATFNSGLCLSVAIFLHFFWLCAFGWMLVEGLFMYFGVTKVFNGTLLKNWHYYIIGYGIPVVVVSVTLLATSASAYRNSSYCWLSYDDNVIWAFAGPVAAVVLMNTIFLMVAFSVALKSKRNRKLGKGRQSNNLRWIFGVFSLTFILGITWLSGFFFFNDASITLAYIFTIANSMQGLVIFITFCVLNQQVRNDLRRQMATIPKFRRLFRRFNIELSDVTRSQIGSRTGTSENQTSETTVNTSTSSKRRRTTVKVSHSVDRNSKRAPEKEVLKPEEETPLMEEKLEVKVIVVGEGEKGQEEEMEEKVLVIEQPCEIQEVGIQDKATDEGPEEPAVNKDDEEEQVIQEQEATNIKEEESSLMNGNHVTIRQHTVNQITYELHESVEERNTKQVILRRAKEMSYSTNLRPTQTTSLRHLVIFTDPK